MLRHPGLRMDRRLFARCGVALAAGWGALESGRLRASDGDDQRFVREASFYEKLPHQKIRCRLCPRECEIDESERGYCGVRENRQGTYYTLVFARPCTYHVDPIEKKPFFHFHPGSQAFSLATAGCNVNCRFCQNWQISQVRPEQVKSIYLPPRDLAALARANDCPSIAYTYSEPVIFFEYVRASAEAARRLGVKSVVVTGGFIAQPPLEEWCRWVDAVKVDVKGFSEHYYKEVVNGELKPVLDALVTLKTQGVWTEIVYLVVPTLNDDDGQLQGLARFIRSNLGPETPLHFSRFYPQYLLKNLPPTPVSTLDRAKQIADAEGLKYVYIGNVPGHRAESTYCPHCGTCVIERSGYLIRRNRLKNAACPQCGTVIPGIWG